MKRKLLSLLLLVVVGGASEAWAKIVWPSNVIKYRINGTLSASTDWNDGKYPEDQMQNGDLEINAKDIWQILEFSIPDIDNVSSITLCGARNGSGSAIEAYAFPYEMLMPGATFSSTFTDNVNTAVTGTSLGTFGSTSLNVADLKTTFSSMIADGTLTLRVVAWTSGKLWGPMAAVPSRRPHLEVAYSGVSPIKNITQDTTPATMADALSAAAEGDVIELYDDVTLTARFGINKSLTFKSAENRNVVIYRFFDNSGLMIGDTDGKTIIFDGSASGSSLTIDDQYHAKNYNLYSSNKAKTTTTFKNVTFRNVSSTPSYVVNSNNGVIILENVTFSNCTPSSALIHANNSNDKIQLKGTLTFTDCTDTHIYSEARFKVDVSSFNPSEVVNINTSLTSPGSVVVLGSSDITSLKPQFNLVNDNKALLQGGTNHKQELQLAEAYTLPITTAGASTLVLPFEATIPAGLTCYNLNYTSGNNISAEAVVSPLGANKAVLVKGDEGSYKFVKTTTAATEAFSGQTAANGVLVGNYDDNFYAPANSYVLQNQATNGLGFYKVAAADSKKVAANRAYMDVTYAAGIRDFFSLDFDGNETTGIKAIDNGQLTMDNVFDIQGRRVSQPQKGLYIVNGKKVFIK